MLGGAHPGPLRWLRGAAGWLGRSGERRFGEPGGKRAQRTVHQQIRVVVMAGGASQEVSGFAELIGERRYF